MNLIRLLTNSWSVAGVEAPSFAWIAALIALTGTFSMLIRLWWQVRLNVRVYSRAAARLKEIKTRYPRNPGDGLHARSLDAASQTFDEFPLLKEVWQEFRSQIIRRRNPGGEEQFWTADSAGFTFSEAALVDGRINRSFFTAVPGIVTGFGLLITFIAILVALHDVRVVDNKVQGIDLLIQGLSGKFVSSIAALSAATVYLLFEKPMLHRLTLSRLQLASAIDELFPRLSPARILADMQIDIAEQSGAFRSFNADLSGRLKQSFSESMGPTLQRMAQTIDDLNQLLRATEAQKQESITGSLGTLLGNLEQSITRSLEMIGTRFTESLSGSTKSEFGRIGDSLGGTAKLLESMNTQFMSTQSALGDLVNLAKTSTAEQMALGKTQIEDLTFVLRGLMAQIEETAGSSVSKMAATLTSVVHDLSTKVGDLSEQLSRTVVESSEKATGAAKEVLSQANRWSSQNAEQLTQLLAQQQDHMGRVREIGTTLDRTLGGFRESLTQYAAISADLRVISTEVSAVASAAGSAAKAMRESQDSVQRVAGLAASNVEKLGESNRQQVQVWEQIAQNMTQYKQVFSQVEKEASSLIAQIEQHIHNHLEVTQKGFENLVRASDEHFANAAQKLNASVTELDEYLQDLTQSLEKAQIPRTGRT